MQYNWHYPDSGRESVENRDFSFGGHYENFLGNVGETMRSIGERYEMQ